MPNWGYPPDFHFVSPPVVGRLPEKWLISGVTDTPGTPVATPLYNSDGCSSWILNDRLSSFFDLMLTSLMMKAVWRWMFSLKLMTQNWTFRDPRAKRAQNRVLVTYRYIQLLLAGCEVRIVKNCDLGLEIPAFSSPKSQFFTIYTARP